MFFGTTKFFRPPILTLHQNWHRQEPPTNVLNILEPFPDWQIYDCACNRCDVSPASTLSNWAPSLAMRGTIWACRCTCCHQRWVYSGKKCVEKLSRSWTRFCPKTKFDFYFFYERTEVSEMNLIIGKQKKNNNNKNNINNNLIEFVIELELTRAKPFYFSYLPFWF